MKRYLAPLLLLLLAAAAHAQTYSTVVTVYTADTSGTPWFNGTYTINFVGPQIVTWPGGPVQRSYSGNIQPDGTFQITLPDNLTITPTPTFWTFTVCPFPNITTSTNFCLVNQQLTISGPAQSINFNPAQPQIPATMPFPVSALQDSNITGPVSLGFSYYQEQSATNGQVRSCAIVATFAPFNCQTWITTSGGVVTGNFPTWNQLLNPNGNSAPQWGGANFTFMGAGVWNFGSLNMQVTQTSTFTPTLAGQLGMNTTTGNLLAFTTSSNIVGLLPANQNFKTGDILTVQNNAGKISLIDSGSNNSGAPDDDSSYLQVTAANPVVNQTFCIDSVIGVIFTATNCSIGVPIFLETTNYTIDPINNRGTAIVSNDASPSTVTYPQAFSPTTDSDANWFDFHVNKGAGDVTLSLTAPSVFDSTGTQSETLHEGQQCSVLTDDSTGIAYPKCHEPRMTVSAPLVFTRSPYNLNISCPTCGTTGGISGMTAGQIPVAASASTITSSVPLKGTDTSILSAGTVTGAGNLLCVDANGGATTTGCTGTTGISGLTSGQVAIAGSATTITSSKAIQGTDTSILSSGAVSGTNVPLCTDANGGATTSGCPGNGMSGMTNGQVAVASSATTIGSSKALQGTDINLLTSGTVSGTAAPLCTDASGGATTVGCPSGSGITSINTSATGPAVTIQGAGGAAVSTAGNTITVSATNASSSATVVYRNNNYQINNGDNGARLVFTAGTAITLPQAGQISTSNFVASRANGRATCSPTCTSSAFSQVAGDTLYVMAAEDTANSVTMTAVSDLAGDTFTLLGCAATTGVTNTPICAYVAVGINVNASNTVTMTWSTTGIDSFWNVIEYSGLTADQFGSNSTTSGSIAASVTLAVHNATEVGVGIVSGAGSSTSCASGWVNRVVGQLGTQAAICDTFVNGASSMTMSYINTGHPSGVIFQDSGSGSTASFTNGWNTIVENEGSSSITLTPTTSTINLPGIGTGLTSLTVQPGQSYWIMSDGTNYNAILVGTTSTIASGTAALGTSAIASSACATVVTVAATGVLTTDNIMADFNADPTSTTGYQAGAMLTIVKYPTANNVNFKVCNNSNASITPAAVTLNWRVVR